MNSTSMRFGKTLMLQADRLAQFTEDPPRVTRRYLTPQHRQAGEYLIGLMRDAGMTAISTRSAMSSAATNPKTGTRRS